MAEWCKDGNFHFLPIYRRGEKVQSVMYRWAFTCVASWKNRGSDLTLRYMNIVQNAGHVPEDARCRQFHLKRGKTIQNAMPV